MGSAMIIDLPILGLFVRIAIASSIPIAEEMLRKITTPVNVVWRFIGIQRDARHVSKREGRHHGDHH
jgi:hypothetical protein